MLIRAAQPGDLPAILAIYNEVILHSTAVYCDDPTTLEERQSWFAGRISKGFPVLVAEDQGSVIGYASFGDFRSFSGFRFTVEHSVHLAAGYRGKGIGSALVKALFPLAKAMNKHLMVAIVDAENQRSIDFHQRMGFAEVGRMPEVARKFDRWLEMVMMQRVID
jgi:L-amino acid N-acyltransferase YncA